MVKEYMTSSGQIAQYDTASKLIVVYDSNRNVVDGPRPAMPDDLTDYYAAYPETTPEQATKRDGLAATLINALTAVRAITSDNQVTTIELQQTLPVIVGALEAYRDYDGPQSDTIDKLINLILAQAVLSVQILITDAYNGLAAISQDSFNVNFLAEGIQDAYNQHIIDYHS